MSDTAYTRLLDALTAHGCTINARGHRKVDAQCPAHEDRRPSLSVTGVEGSVLLHCQANCPTEDVVSALNLTMRDLYDDPRDTRYPYDNGRVAHRTWDKRFWQTGIDNPPQLYRLAKVTAAIAAGSTVYVVEGEKDVHAMESLGAVATCNPMGAGKWSKVDPSPLYGGRVIVIEDRDAPGAKHAQDVAASLRGRAVVSIVAPVEPCKDAADHIAAGHGLADFRPPEPDPEFEPLPEWTSTTEPEEGGIRRMVLTTADTIKPRPVFWLWDNRLALGTLALLAGREGLGKSTLGYWAAARITRGELPGEHHGIPRSVMVCATEDSWEHTIVPRLIAAGADLGRVHKVDVITAMEVHVGLSLPRDLIELEHNALAVDAAMLLLDPLISRLGDLDTHRDAEVRQALEPLVAIADRTDMAIVGIIHHNKSGSTDALQLVMGSKAFTAVARSVHTVVPDPDDETNRVRLFGSPKNNLGRDDLPTLTFTIESHRIDTDEGDAWTGRIEWGEEQARSIHDALCEGTEDRSATTEATEWLRDYLAANGGQVKSADAKKAGKAVGHTERTLQRAIVKLRLVVSSSGFPRVTWWEMPVAPQSGHGRAMSLGDGATDMTGVTEGEKSQVSPVAPVAPDAPDGERDGMTGDGAPQTGEPDLWEPPDDDDGADWGEYIRKGKCSVCHLWLCICRAAS